MIVRGETHHHASSYEEETNEDDSTNAIFPQDHAVTIDFNDKFLQNFLCRNLGLEPVLKKYTGYQIYQYKYNRIPSTLVSIYVTQDKYNTRTSTLILCKHVIVRAQQENKGSAVNNKQKTMRQ
jgi:hypothetical protein